MTTGRHLTFGAFVLDADDACLRRGTEDIDLRPRSLALLRYLAENPGRVVTKDELLGNVWAGTRVSDTVLKVCVREIREALGDAAKTPRFIETLPRQGYRFVAAVGTQLAEAAAGDADERFAWIVGRARELAQLETWLAEVEQCQRKLVFVTGEPGVGKTTLVDLFLVRSRVRERLRVGRGQCLERYGEGEAYLPVLEALGHLCSEPGGERLVTVLRQYAPTWLVQLPALVDDRELETLQRRGAGSTRERMLREITEALEAYGSSVGLGLVLEDLQWSDYSTLELLAYLAHRRREVRLLVVATYRPAEVAQRQHPLAGIKQELHAHGQCEELVVERLGTADVSDYVARRLGAAAGPALGPVVHARTEGNALFMVNLVEYALGAGLVGAGEAGAALAAAVPETLRQMIGKQLGDLGEETRGLLEVASVTGVEPAAAGVEFTAAGVAAGAQCAVETVERACDVLAGRGQVLRKRAVVAWPDGTVSAGYAFVHGFYRQVLYEDMGDGQRARVHRAIGLRKEAAYGGRADAIASELALHFECGHDYPRALRYHRTAGESDLKRSAYREAAAHFRRALAMIAMPEMVEMEERDREELDLQEGLANALMPTGGAAAPDVEQVYARAWELCQRIGDSPRVASVVWGLSNAYQLQGKLDVGRQVGEYLLQLNRMRPDPTSAVLAHLGVGCALLWQGELEGAAEHLEQSLAAPHTVEATAAGRLFARNAKVHALCISALIDWARGYPDRALSRVREAAALAATSTWLIDQAAAQLFAVVVHQFRRDHAAARDASDALAALATEHGLSLMRAGAQFFHGSTVAELGDPEAGVAEMRRGLAAWRDTGARLLEPYLLSLLASGLTRAGQQAEAATTLHDALADGAARGERFWEGEIQRQRGALAHQHTPRRGRGTKAAAPASDEDEAEACFTAAVEAARRQGSRSLELRAAVSLAGLWRDRGRTAEARQLLGPIYEWFGEGFDTPDLRDAKGLLDGLG